jgi:hypothetical protein
MRITTSAWQTTIISNELQQRPMSIGSLRFTRSGNSLFLIFLKNLNIVHERKPELPQTPLEKLEKQDDKNDKKARPSNELDNFQE